VDKLDDYKLAPNLPPTTGKSEPPEASQASPTRDDERAAVAQAIADAMPQAERWGVPAALSNRSSVGHGARPKTREDLVEELTDSALEHPRDRTVDGLDVGRVRRAQATLNELFAGYLEKAPGTLDPTSEGALRDFVEQAEAYRDKHEAERGAAIAATLMVELPSVYDRVLRDELDDTTYEAAVRKLLDRVHLLPRDPILLERVLDELLVERSFIEEALDDLPRPDGSTVKRKLPGSVETAVYTLSVALDLLGVTWPHRRGSLFDARKMTDRERAVALAPGPFGTRVGAGEASGHAARSAFGDERTTVTLPDREPKGPAT
jgi:hypothetical protein